MSFMTITKPSCMRLFLCTLYWAKGWKFSDVLTAVDVFAQVISSVIIIASFIHNRFAEIINLNGQSRVKKATEAFLKTETSISQ